MEADAKELNAQWAASKNNAVAIGAPQASASDALRELQEEKKQDSLRGARESAAKSLAKRKLKRQMSLS